MPLRVAIQMDPLSTVETDKDSTYALMWEAQGRGATLFVYEPKDLVFEEGDLVALGVEVHLTGDDDQPFSCGPRERRDLSAFDVLLVRQDPPFDLAYLTATYLLEHLSGRVLMINNPVSIRNAPEKLLVTHYPALIPETLITRDLGTLKAFRARHRDIVLKPLYGNGGAGVFKVLEGDGNFSALVEWFLRDSPEPWIAQKYLPDIAQGDRRILLVEGRPVGAFNRMALAGEARSNLHAGGTAVPYTLTTRDLEICQTIGPDLEREGLVFVGIDVIGGYLTEINVTSPTGIHEVRNFGGEDIAVLVWDAIEKRRAQ